MKRIITLALSFLMLFAVASCADKNKTYEAEDKSFSAGGITIILTEAFETSEREGCVVAYGASDAAVFIMKEEFSSFENENMSLDKYAGFIRKANEDRAPTEVSKENGFSSIEYVFKDSDTEYKYFVAMFEGSDAYWCIQFTCESSLYSEYRPYFIKWAKTVAFAPKA